jgi:hypothetical protein
VIIMIRRGFKVIHLIRSQLTMCRGKAKRHTLSDDCSSFPASLTGPRFLIPMCWCGSRMTIGRPSSAGSTTEDPEPAVEVDVSLLPCLLVKMLEPEVERVPSVELDETRLVVAPALMVSGFESARRPKT